jgi:cell division protein FtsB
MKKLILFATVVVFLFSLTACGGGGKYADAKRLMEKQVQLFEDFINALDKAGSANDVAAALNDFSDEMQKMVPQMKELQEKYPELKDAKDEAIRDYAQIHGCHDENPAIRQ